MKRRLGACSWRSLRQGRYDRERVRYALAAFYQLKRADTKSSNKQSNRVKYTCRSCNAASRRVAGGLYLELAVEGEELLEACTAAGELGGAALEGDAAVFDEDDAVHVLDAGQVVGDHHHAAAFQHCEEVFE